MIDNQPKSNQADTRGSPTDIAHQLSDTAADQDRLLTELDDLAWLLDESIRLPGGFRVGVDALLGLLPGVGDLAGLSLALVLIGKARRAGASRGLQARMLFNVVVEAIIGVIPLVGDVFDFWFKANRRNMDLLRDFLSASRRP